MNVILKVLTALILIIATIKPSNALVLTLAVDPTFITSLQIESLVSRIFFFFMRLHKGKGRQNN